VKLLINVPRASGPYFNSLQTSSGSSAPPSHTGMCISPPELILRVGQDHIYTVYIRYFWQGNHQICGHIRCICTVLADPTHFACTLFLWQKCQVHPSHVIAAARGCVHCNVETLNRSQRRSQRRLEEQRRAPFITEIGAHFRDKRELVCSSF